MVARRWMWVGAGALALVWLARGARAEVQLEDPPDAKPARAEPRAPADAARRPSLGYAADSARTATRLTPEEREARGFLRSAAVASRFEAEASRLAVTRAQSPAVVAFAADVLQYQETAQVELMHLLHARGMAAPMMDNAQRKALLRLARLSGTRFDREYAALLGARQQREDVRHYERAVLGISDPALKGWIDRQLPSLREQQTAAGRLGGREPRRGEGPRSTSLAAQAAARQRTE